MEVELASTPLAVAERPPRRKDAVKRKRNWTVEDPPEHVVHFVHWYVHERGIGQTLDEYAQSVGRLRQNVQAMLRDARVVEMLERELRLSNAGPLRVQAVLDMLHKRAVCDEDVKAATAYLQAVGKMAPRQVDVRVHDVRDWSDEQLRVELKRAVALLERNASAGTEDEAEVIEDSEVLDTT